MSGLSASELIAVPSPAGNDVKSEPSPTNLVAVTIPVNWPSLTCKLVVVLIPGPVIVVSYVNGIILFDYL